MADAWDRLEDEPIRWFDRFERFRSMGPQRTLLGCVQGEAKEGNKKQPSGIPGAWSEAAEAWRWRERAEAWDAAQTQLARAAESSDLADRRKKWIASARALQDKAMERLATIDAVDLNFKDIREGITSAIKLELLARGEPTDINKNENSGDICGTEAERFAAIAAIVRRYLSPEANAQSCPGSPAPDSDGTTDEVGPLLG